MAWEFTDRQLANEARRIARLVAGLAWLTAIVTLIAVIAGFFLSGYQGDRRDVLGDIARIKGEIQAAAARGPTAPSISKSDVRAILAEALRYDGMDEDATDDRYAVFDPAGNLLAEIGAASSAPVLRVERPLASSGGAKLGHIVVEKSLQETLRQTGLAAIVATLLAAAALFALRALPMHAFYRAMVRLDRAQQARSQAEAGLRAHVLQLEKAQEALQETTTHLQLALEAAAESSQSKSQFLASMSHELRTPLNAIIGFSEIMENQLFGPIGNERYGEYVNLILGSGKHLLSLVNEILDLSKAGAGRIELYDGEIDLALMVRDLMRTMQATADKAEVRLISAIPEDLPHLLADPQRMTQIMLNLIANAIKFNVASGTVRIDAEYRPFDGMKITVTDSGIGIAAENIPKALERFGQVENSFTRRHQGTGLGLPISKKLTELHGGTLMIKSAIGEGTTVTVWLPPERVIDLGDGISFEMTLRHEI